MNKHFAWAALGAAVLLAAFTLPGAPCAAQEEYLDCYSGNLNQMQLNECAARDFHAADAELNAAYKKLSTLVNSHSVPVRIEALIAAEKAWIVFRDTECEYQGANYEGGSIQPMIVSRCLAAMTRRRTIDLKKQYSLNMEGDAMEFSQDTLMPIEAAARSYSMQLAGEDPGLEYDVIGAGFECEVYMAGIGEIMSVDCERQVTDIMSGGRFASVWTGLAPLDCEGGHVRDAAPGATFLMMHNGTDWIGIAWALSPEDTYLDQSLIKKYDITEDDIGPLGWGLRD